MTRTIRKSGASQDGFIIEQDGVPVVLAKGEREARLALAAPDLLAALTNLLALGIDELADPEDVDECHAAALAIDKATQP